MRFRHVAVVGLMGAGKTTIGRLLAVALGFDFSDSDLWIEARTGRTVRELGAEIGTEAMHELESTHLLEALAADEPSVIAAAASTIDVPACRAALVGPDVAVVWLRASPETLAARFRRKRHRPSFGQSPEVLLREQAAFREPEFARLAPIVVDVEERSPEESAEAVLLLLRART